MVRHGTPSWGRGGPPVTTRARLFPLLSLFGFASQLLAPGLAIVIIASPAAADLILPLSQARTIHAGAIGMPDQTDSEDDAASGFAPFSSTVHAQVDGARAEASQESEIRSNQLIGSGSAWADGGAFTKNGGAFSEARIQFELLEDLNCDLVAILHAGVSVLAESSAIIELRDAFDDPILSEAAEGCGDFVCDVSISESGILGAGIYTLMARADATSSEAGIDAAFSFEFTVTPEPSTALLLGLGLAGLGLQRRLTL